MRSKSIQLFVKANSDTKFNYLSTDVQTFFGLLKLIVDIEYRHKYGFLMEEKQLKEYNLSTMKKVVADQITPVDDGLLRH